MEALFQPYAAGAAATALAPLGKSKTFPGFIIHLSQVSYESPEVFLGSRRLTLGQECVSGPS